MWERYGKHKEKLSELNCLEKNWAFPSLGFLIFWVSLGKSLLKLFPYRFLTKQYWIPFKWYLTCFERNEVKEALACPSWLWNVSIWLKLSGTRTWLIPKIQSFEQSSLPLYTEEYFVNIMWQALRMAEWLMYGWYSQCPTKWWNYT